MNYRAVWLVGLTSAVVVIGTTDARADAVTEWNTTAGRAALVSCVSLTDPMHESRMYAMVHVAIHDALNAIERRSRPYAFDERVDGPVSARAAVAAAARDVLVTALNQIPPEALPPDPACQTATGVAIVQADYTAALAGIPDGPAKASGLTLGQRSAAAILDQRANDGSAGFFLDFGYPQGTKPGEYRFHELPFVAGSFWGRVTPFVLKDASQFRAAPPYDVASKDYAADFNEVRALGSDNVSYPSARTPDQTQIAFFWYESAPLGWNRIARRVSADRGLDLWDNARLFGLLNLAVADAYIGSFDSKFHFNFWRPITAIREADYDGNSDTWSVAGWTPLLLTPPVPDHDSAHSVAGGAAAQVLANVFGGDDIAFTTCSTSLPGASCDASTPVFRSFNSFSQAAEENGLSRILVGMHFRHAVEEGIKHGHRIGMRTVNLLMKPTGH